jgi:phage virion morphogenesis protein
MGGASMTNQLEALEDWAAGLLGQLEPLARNRLARSLGQALRRSQQQRIMSQCNPEGSKYVPRQQRNLRVKQGRVKREVQMFQKLRTTRFLRVRGDDNAASVGFTGRIARIARVHQYGLKDRAETIAPPVRYNKRKLIGLTHTDIVIVRDKLLTHLSNETAA